MSNDPGPELTGYTSRGGLEIRRYESNETYVDAMEPVRTSLDDHRGLMLTSSFEYPGRYTRWDMGFINPALQVEARRRQLVISALNPRGELLIPPIAAALEHCDAIAESRATPTRIDVRVLDSEQWFAEELRSKQPSVFSVLRALIELFGCADEPHLGLYGAFGYELAFQFEPIRQRLPRDPERRDLVLYLPDELLMVDHRTQQATCYRYEFEVDGVRTDGRPREGDRMAYVPGTKPERPQDHGSGEYAQTVREAIDAFARGDLFEVVPGQTFFEACPAPPSEVFARLRERNPAPYGALINLGLGEYLVAASPEMYVRVDGRRIETCPISGTIARGATPIDDASQILALLNSRKEESELTMCTDVDRNDKSRVCEPDSIKVIGRRQIEMYSRLIHTVDHVEGRLREGYDALDGFLAHTWAVTVTGAPKQHAIQFIEDHERSERGWYGGAMGCIGFNGNMNTGLTLRTVRIADGVAEVRAGATLLFESDPDAEEAETRLKASALLDAILRPDAPPVVRAAAPGADTPPGAGRRILMVDHEDSFVHTLAGYFRRTGAEVMTYRSGFSRERLDDARADLVLLSPGPGLPSDFDLSRTIAMVLEANLPMFGVCLGLQGLVEHFGGVLDTLPTPMHGKASTVNVLGGRLFEGLPERFEAGRYHSVYAREGSVPQVFETTAMSDDGIVMAVEHRDRPIAAVQFHPESILTLKRDFGFEFVTNVMRVLPHQT